MYDLNTFSMMDMTNCCAVLRRLGQKAQSMEEAAQRIVDHLHENLIDGRTQRPAMVLTRLFKTHAYGDLDDSLREFARGVLGDPDPPAEMKCFPLLASRGERPEWNGRESSVGHKAIPLRSVELVRQFPMVSNLIKQLGLEISNVVAPDPSCLNDLEETTYNVFHVAHVPGSPYVPAQEDFVLPFGVRSVLGFGGVLPHGDLFAVILFSRLAISHETAGLFRPMALAVKVALLPFTQSVFCMATH